MKTSFFAGILATILIQTSGVHADSTLIQPMIQPMIQIDAQPVSDQFSTVSLTSGAVSDLMSSPGVSVTLVSANEILRAAAERGVALTVPPSDRKDYGHPYFIVKAGIGLPALVNAEIEVYITSNITVEGGVGGSLGGTIFTGALKWRPDATCFGCNGSNMFSIGFGVENQSSTGASTRNEVIFLGTVDAMYVHRFAEHFGWVIGLKLGGGVDLGIINADALPSQSGQTTGTYVGAVDPGITGFLYTGFSF